MLLDAHPEANGGLRIGWQGTRSFVVARLVGEQDALAAELRAIAGDRLVIEHGRRTEASLRALHARLNSDAEELEAMGIGLAVSGVDVEREVVAVDIVSADAAEAARTLHERYGPAVHVDDCQPAWLAVAPRAFGSWSAEDRTLAVFYGVDHNGERPHACTADEGEDMVVVCVEILAPTRPVTAIGGWQLLTAELTLQRPLGSRRVIDAATGDERPSLTDLRRGA